MDIEVKKEVEEEVNNEEEINEEVEEVSNEVETNQEEVNNEEEVNHEEEINTEVNNEKNKKDIPWKWILGIGAFFGGITIGYLCGKNSSDKKISVLSNALKISNDINTDLRVENLMLKDELKYSDALNKKMASDLLRGGRELGGKEMRRLKYKK